MKNNLQKTVFFLLKKTSENLRMKKSSEKANLVFNGWNWVKTNFYENVFFFKTKKNVKKMIKKKKKSLCETKFFKIVLWVKLVEKISLSKRNLKKSSFLLHETVLKKVFDEILFFMKPSFYCFLCKKNLLHFSFLLKNWVVFLPSAARHCLLCVVRQSVVCQFASVCYLHTEDGREKHRLYKH